MRDIITGIIRRSGDMWYAEEDDRPMFIASGGSLMDVQNGINDFYSKELGTDYFEIQYKRMNYGVKFVIINGGRWSADW